MPVRVIATEDRGWPSTTATLTLLLVAALASAGQAQRQRTDTVLSSQPSGSAATGQVILKPGDLLRVTVWRKPEYSGEFGIAADGSVLHPLYRQVRVTGVPLAELETRFRDYLKELEAEPQFVLEPLFRVSVEGEVGQPNVFNLRPETTIAQAIAMARGQTERGRRDRVRVFRDGNYLEVNLRGSGAGSGGMPVQSGDRIIVDRQRDTFREVIAPTVSVLGGVAAIISVFLYSSNR